MRSCVFRSFLFALIFTRSLFICEARAASGSKGPTASTVSVSEAFTSVENVDFSPSFVTDATVKSSLSAVINLNGMKSSFIAGDHLTIKIGNFTYDTVLGSVPNDKKNKFTPGKSLKLLQTVGGVEYAISVSYSTKKIGVKIGLTGEQAGIQSFTLGVLGTTTDPNAISLDPESQVGIAHTSNVPATIILGNVEADFLVALAVAAPKRSVKEKDDVTSLTTLQSAKGKAGDGTAKAFDTTQFFSGVKMGNTAGTYNPGFLPDATLDPNSKIQASGTVIQNGSLLFQLLTPTAPDKILVGVAGTPGYYELTVPTTSVRVVQSGPGKYNVNGVGQEPRAQQVYTLDATIPPSLASDLFNLVVEFVVGGTTSRVGDHTLTVNHDATASRTLQVSLNFSDPVDYDLHVQTPDLTDIYYGNRTGEGGGTLDLDSNAGCSIDNVDNENITWVTGAPCGHYKVRVDLWSACNLPGPFPYSVNVTLAGTTTTYTGSMSAAQADHGGSLSGTVVAEFDVTDAQATLVFSAAPEGDAGNKYGYDDFETPDSADDHVSVKAGDSTNVNCHVAGCALGSNVFFKSQNESVVTVTAPANAGADFLLQINGVAAGHTNIEAHYKTIDGDLIGQIAVDCYKEQAIARWDVYRITDSASPGTQGLSAMTQDTLAAFAKKVAKQGVVSFTTLVVTDKDIHYDLNGNGALDWYYDGGTQTEHAVIAAAGLTGDPKIAVTKKVNFVYRLANAAAKDQKQVKLIGNTGNYLNGFRGLQFHIGKGATLEDVNVAAGIGTTITLVNNLRFDHPAGDELYCDGGGASADPQVVADPDIGTVHTTCVHETFHRPNVCSVADITEAGRESNVMNWYTGQYHSEFRIKPLIKNYSQPSTEQQWNVVPRP